MNNARFIRYFILISSLFFSAHAADFTQLLPKSLDWVQLSKYHNRKEDPIIAFADQYGFNKPLIKKQFNAWGDLVGAYGYENPEIEKIKNSIEDAEERNKKNQDKSFDDFKKMKQKEIISICSKDERIIRWNVDKLVNENSLFPIIEPFQEDQDKIDENEFKELIQLQLLITSYVPINIIEEGINELSDYCHYIVSLSTFFNWLINIAGSKKNLDKNNKYTEPLKILLKKYKEEPETPYAKQYLNVVKNQMALTNFLASKHIINQPLTEEEKALIREIEAFMRLHGTAQPNNPLNQNQNLNPNLQQRNFGWYYEKIKSTIAQKKVSIPAILFIFGIFGYFNKERLKTFLDSIFSRKNRGR